MRTRTLPAGTLSHGLTAETIPGPLSTFCADLARKHEIYLIPGSLYEKEGQAIYNTAPILPPRGK